VAAEEVELIDMRSYQRWIGRNVVSGWLTRNLSGVKATPRLSRRGPTFDDGSAAAEWALRGRRVSWHEGEEPAMADLALPLVAVFEVESNQITNIRLYGFTDALVGPNRER
jgi:hypothetical protein